MTTTDPDAGATSVCRNCNTPIVHTRAGSWRERSWRHPSGEIACATGGTEAQPDRHPQIMTDMGGTPLAVGDTVDIIATGNDGSGQPAGTVLHTVRIIRIQRPGWVVLTDVFPNQETPSLPSQVRKVADPDAIRVMPAADGHVTLSPAAYVALKQLLAWSAERLDNTLDTYQDLLHADPDLEPADRALAESVRQDQRLATYVQALTGQVNAVDGA